MMTLFEIRNALADGTSIYELPLKVTYYARVSTDKYEQLNSLENQVTYYENYIKENCKWTFVEGYIDEGISGTSTNKRDSFKRMIRDGKNGKFNLIITKEISRFARDTLDSISYTRKLLEYGVGVFFQYDHINTFNSDSELRLTIMASIAQEEVRKLSERVKFGFQRSIESGKVLGNDFIWGYKKDKCKLVIVEEEAEIIRKIFDMYVNEHLGMRSIGNKLAGEGILNKNGKPFQQGTIKYILTNPKYKGYYCGNKTRVIDYHTKQRVNINEEDWKLYEDNINVPPIVSEYIWNKAQEIVKSRSDRFSTHKEVYQNRYPFSGKIFCMNHNITYRRKKQISSGKKKKVVITWRCSHFLKYNTTGCDGPILYDDELKEIVGKSILKYISNVSIVDELIKEYKTIEDNKDYSKDIEKKKDEIERLERSKSKILDLIVKELINEDDFKKQSDEIVSKIHKLENEISELETKSKSILTNYKYLEEVRKKALEKLKYENADIDSLIYEFLEKIEVYKLNDNNYISLRVILNTGNQYGITFKHGEHPFGTNYTYNAYKKEAYVFNRLCRYKHDSSHEVTYYVDVDICFYNYNEL